MSTNPKAVKKPFSVEATAAGKRDDLRMDGESIRTKLLATIVKAKKIDIDALEKKSPGLTRGNIVAAIYYLIGKGYIRRA